MSENSYSQFRKTHEIYGRIMPSAPLSRDPEHWTNAMSDTTSNTHFSTDATNIAAALDAQTEATLALAYEQHTANLIAFYATIPSKLGSDTQQLRSQIQERLGLS